MASVVASKIWLVLLRAQRPMMFAEISKALPDLSHVQRAAGLNSAYHLGYIERTGKAGNFSYAVTPRCYIPTGVEVREVMEATA